jgi:hypothetical protein
MDELRQACAEVARRAQYVRIEEAAIPTYAADLELDEAPGPSAALGPPAAPATADDLEARAAFWITLDAINFGSGWFPTLRKAPGKSGYNTIAGALTEHFDRAGPWSAEELTNLTA